jgi:hypothetical protein
MSYDKLVSDHLLALDQLETLQRNFDILARTKVSEVIDGVIKSHGKKRN